MKEQKYRNTKTDTLEIYVGILNLSQRQDGLLHVCGEAEGAGGGGDEEAGQVILSQERESDLYLVQGP